MNKYLLTTIIAILVAAVLLAGCSKEQQTQPDTGSDTNTKEVEVKLYKSESCGCCALYGSYLQKQDLSLTIEQMADITPIKDKLGIPTALRSCHTLEVDGYFVEGHIPKEAIDKLLAERPADVIGIAMPGMPSGSPGMPGAKTSPFVIYAVHKDGTQTEFMRM